eukprot:SAG11_NODE_261_length_11530_cov_8.418861_1_plen_36_part_00
MYTVYLLFAVSKTKKKKKKKGKEKTAIHMCLVSQL